MTKLPRVECDCNGLTMSGTFEVDGEWLVLRSPLGVNRVRLGVSNPRKIAAKLLKNLCAKASKSQADMPCCISTVSDKARGRIDFQRDKIIAMAPDDPMRPREERTLDQMIATSRVVVVADALLKPPSG